MDAMQPEQNYNPIPPQPNIPTQQPQTPMGNNYDFILNPEQLKQRKISMPGNSPLMRIVIVFVALIVVLILFNVIKGLLVTPPFNKSAYLAVIEQQTEILHIITVDIVTQQEKASLSSNNLNFVATTQVVITSNQNETLAYLAKNKDKLNPKIVILVLQPSLDTQLSNSLQTNSFNQGFSQIMQSQISAYRQKIGVAYKSTTGSKGKSLLKAQYHDAELLLKQLNLRSG
jgi:hypothetical protein